MNDSRRRGLHSRQARDHSNTFLASIGLALIGLAAAGFIFDKSEALSAGFLIVGAALCIVAVLLPRLEGTQKVSLTSLELTVAAAVVRGEKDILEGRVTSLEESQ